MTRAVALACAIVAIALTLAQFVWPARDFYHAWQYITLLALTIVVMLGYAWNARAGTDGTVGKRLALALTGAIVAAAAGLLSGLIGPDTVTVLGAPGTVAPLADLGVAAFFGAADAATIAHGNATVTLRRRGADALSIGERPTALGLSVVFLTSRPAAYVEARDMRGNRLTVTQPTNASFLSPVVLFRQTQALRDRTYPMDTFATPAVHRIARVLYFRGADLAAFQHGVAGGDAPAAVLSVADDQGNARGLTIAASGVPVTVGDVQLTITLGSYPALVIASAPQPAVTAGGIALFVVAALWAAVAARRSRPLPISSPSLTQT